MKENISDLVKRIEELAHTKVADCYQCGKCTAGCPRAEVMDLTPSQLLRFVQCGEIEDAVKARSIWQCVSCQTCSVRCPKSVNTAGVIDALRQISWEDKLTTREMEKVILFQSEFLNNIRRNGRTNELELVGMYKMRGFFGDFSIPQALKDASLGPKMLVRRKLHFKPGSPVKDKAVVQRIFERCGVK